MDRLEKEEIVCHRIDNTTLECKKSGNLSQTYTVNGATLTDNYNGISVKGNHNGDDLINWATTGVTWVKHGTLTIINYN